MQRGHPAARAARSEEGFTLLELMMVVLIIAIMIAVLMPVLSGASSRAKDRAMQQNLSTAVKAAKVSYNEKLDYTQVGLGTLTSDSALNFVAGGVAPDTQDAVSVDILDESYIVLSGQSKAGDCFYVSDDGASGATQYARLGGAGGCAANGAPLPNDPVE